MYFFFSVTGLLIHSIWLCFFYFYFFISLRFREVCGSPSSLWLPGSYWKVAGL
uniref:Uncharacterized protein n=1 Tax=Anguilla anguilla TaxID=7936 RepID=A0A0E9Q204_ANGAN